MGRFHDIVAKHHEESDAVLVANREPCISIAEDEEENVTGRSFTVARPGELGQLELQASWVMAVLLCPQDTAEKVAEWIVSENRPAHRVLFYLHPETSAEEALAPWEEADLQIHNTWTVSNWRELHKHLGSHWNVQIFEDFG